MRGIIRWLFVAGLALGGLPAKAAFHLWSISELFSNADGSVQYLVLEALTGGQQFLRGHQLQASQGVVRRSFTFPNDLPGDSSGRRFLVGTRGFADLGVVTPDYVVENGFFPLGNGVIDFAGSSDIWSYAGLPANGTTALLRSGAIRQNAPVNFAGQRGTVTLPAAGALNFQALWFNPAEAGWGLNVAHQGDIVFATLFTYDAAGAPMWLVMSDGRRQGTADTFTGDLFRTTGPAFNAQPFPPLAAQNVTRVGSMTLAFTGQNAATLRYDVNGVGVDKAIERQVFGSRAASCATASGSRASATNFQDLWFRADESGWGINITHQDDILFATLFTYRADSPTGTTNPGLWLVMSEGRRQPDGSYSGALLRTRGAAFNTQPFPPLRPEDITTVGTLRLRFTSGTTATLEYTVDGAPVTKNIVRQEFAPALPVCTS